MRNFTRKKKKINAMNAVSCENGQVGVVRVKQKTPVYVRIDSDDPIFMNVLKIPIVDAF